MFQVPQMTRLSQAFNTVLIQNVLIFTSTVPSLDPVWIIGFFSMWPTAMLVMSNPLQSPEANCSLTQQGILRFIIIMLHWFQHFTFLHKYESISLKKALKICTVLQKKDLCGACDSTSLKHKLMCLDFSRKRKLKSACVWYFGGDRGEGEKGRRIEKSKIYF